MFNPQLHTETEFLHSAEEALALLYDLIEECKHDLFAVQTIMQKCEPALVESIKEFISLCRETRSTTQSESARDIRSGLIMLDRARRKSGDRRHSMGFKLRRLHRIKTLPRPVENNV